MNLIKVTAIMAALLMLAPCAAAFDSPSCGDPWYYQTNDRGLTFMVPDKAQHYWGTRVLVEIAKPYMPDAMACALALAAGFAWEVKDSYTSLGTPGNGSVGFSCRDLIADLLGAGGALIDNKDVMTWVNWSTTKETITFNASVRFK